MTVPSRQNRPGSGHGAARDAPSAAARRYRRTCGFFLAVFLLQKIYIAVSRQPPAGGKRSAMRTVFVVFAVSRLYPAEVIVHYHCLNDRAINNLPPVGASIARPLRTDARPVIMAIFFTALAFCFTSLRIFTGGRPMAAPTGAIIKPFCHSENGKIPKTSAGYNRATAKTMTSALKPNCFPAAAGRAGRFLRSCK